MRTYCILDMSNSPRMSESTSRRGKHAKHIEQGSARKVVEDDDDRAARETRPRRRDSRERRPWTRRRTFLQDSGGTGEQIRVHQTRRAVNQYVRVCAEECPLTTRHTATRSGDSCQVRTLGRDLSRRHRFGGTGAQKPKARAEGNDAEKSRASLLLILREAMATQDSLPQRASSTQCRKSRVTRSAWRGRAAGEGSQCTTRSARSSVW